jgi:hypothetical protein
MSHNVPNVPRPAPTVPLETFLKLKNQLREAKQRQHQAEAERDELRTTLDCVLEGLKGAEK